MITVVALVAGALTTGAWLPQIWQTWRSRSARDLSWGYLGVTGCGMGTWLTYGLLAGDAAVIVTNVVTISLLATLTVLKVRLTLSAAHSTADGLNQPSTPRGRYESPGLGAPRTELVQATSTP